MKRILSALGYWLAIVFVIGASFSAGFLYRVWNDSAVAFRQARGNLLIAGLRGNEPVSATRIYDCYGNQLATAFVENRFPVTLDKISPWVVKGFVATEDRKFYDHWGVDIQRIVKHD